MTHKNDIYDDIVDVILETTKLNLGEDATNIFVDEQMKQNNSIKLGDHKDEDL